MSAILVLDTETTGLDPIENRLVQIAATLYVDRKPVSSFNQKVSVKEGVVSLAALKVNKLHIESLGSYGVHEGLAIAHFFDYLMTALRQHKEVTLCGMNIAFDLAFIKAAASRYGIRDVEAVLPRKVVDTQILAQALKLAGVIDTKSVKSEELYKLFNVEVENEKLHSAEVDVEKTALLYFKIETLLSLLPKNTQSEHVNEQ